MVIVEEIGARQHVLFCGLNCLEGHIVQKAHAKFSTGEEYL